VDLVLSASAVGTHNVAVLVAGAALLILGLLARWREPECTECSHCRQRKHQQEQAQKDRRHDKLHEFGGTCADESCDKNPRGRLEP
jgi:hypothetical protein